MSHRRREHDTLDPMDRGGPWGAGERAGVSAGWALLTSAAERAGWTRDAQGDWSHNGDLMVSEDRWWPPGAIDVYQETGNPFVALLAALSAYGVALYPPTK